MIKRGNRIDIIKKCGEIKPYFFNKTNNYVVGAQIRRELKELDQVTRRHRDRFKSLVGGKKNVFFDVERDIFLEKIANCFGTSELSDFNKEMILNLDLTLIFK